MQNNKYPSQRASDTDEDWGTRIKKFVNDWDDEGGRNPLVHRHNFERFVATETISDCDEWQACLKRHFQDRAWIFRGHNIATWLLVPSLERATLKTISTGGTFPISGSCRLMPDYSETNLLVEFQRRAHVYFPDVPRDDQIVEWLALMQHYGVSTRLLDWTRSPYVSLYFALEMASPPNDCAVWAIDIHWLQQSSDQAMREFDPGSPGVLDLKTKNEYLNTLLLRQDYASIVGVVNPLRLNDRIAAQQGLFLCNLSHIEDFDISLLRMITYPTVPDRPVVQKIVIKTAGRITFLEELNRMNIHGASLLPDIYGFARRLNVNLEMELDRHIRKLNGETQ